MVDVYVLGRIPYLKQDIELAQPTFNNDIPVSFTEKLANYMFHSFDKHFKSGAGDEVILLSLKLDISDLLHKDDFIASFKARVRCMDDLASADIVARRSIGGDTNVQPIVIKEQPELDCEYMFLGWTEGASGCSLN